MLNLGLESLSVVEDVSDAEVLQASIECMQAEMELDRALYDAQTFANNMHNYNEIVKSLKVHSSAECLAFAQELLGTSLEEDVTQSATYKAQAKKITVSRRVYRTLRNWWRKFVLFLRKIGSQIRGLFKSSKAGEKPSDVRIEVPISMQDLDKLGYTLKAIQDGKDISVDGAATASEKPAVITAEDADAYVEKSLKIIETCADVTDWPESAATDPKTAKKVAAVKKVAKKVTKAAAGGRKVTEALTRAKKLNSKPKSVTTPINPKSSGSAPKNAALNHILGKDKNAKAPTGVRKLIKTKR